MNEVNYTFKSFNKFLQWKEKEEKDTNTIYVQHTSSRVRLGIHIHYFYCNRSGEYTSKGTGKRCLKSQGTSKIGCYCTAHIIAKKQENGHVFVEFNSTHYNHDIELAHLTLTEDIHLQVPAKLQQGVTIEKILDSIRDTVAEKMERKHLISRQDIHNIKRQYNIDGIERHTNDYTSVQAWVEQCKTFDYNPIVVFKQQGNEQNDDTDDLGQNDFLLVIQTEFQ